MEIIVANKQNTVGIISKVDGLKNVGTFDVKNLEAWIEQIKMVLGDETVMIHFKLSDNPQANAYMICASHGEDPRVAVVGRCKTDGSEWK